MILRRKYAFFLVSFVLFAFWLLIINFFTDSSSEYVWFKWKKVQRMNCDGVNIQKQIV